MSELQDGPPTTAVLLTDIQADFTEFGNGSLAVPGTGSDYVESVKKATLHYMDEGLSIYAVQDRHPPDHVSFYTNHSNKKPFDTIPLGRITQILWPPHCVRDTPGARLLFPESWAKEIVQKGTDPDHDSYSAFKDDGGRKTGIDDILRRDGISELIVYGLATDFCIRYTVNHALEAGYRVRVRIDLCRGVSEDTTKEAVRDMKSRGAVIETAG